MTGEIGEIGFLAIGNDELGGPLGINESTRCPGCLGEHTVAGTDDGSDMLLFVKCPSNGKAYLVGIDGKIIKRGGN